MSPSPPVVFSALYDRSNWRTTYHIQLLLPKAPTQGYPVDVTPPNANSLVI
ncbi:hypothetical protein [Baaleninema sp.]|uniref:hypothetical protein n=1 Tax=Baaleninema sp. TaxID=3101197 RepID=UPI003D06CC3D